MLIELQRVTHIKCQKKINLFNLFKGSCKLSLSDSVICYHANAAEAKMLYTAEPSKQSTTPFVACNLLNVNMRLALALSGSKKKKQALIKLFRERLNEVLQALQIVHNYACRSLTFTKLFFPHKCINIFVHFSGKTNLLFRSENKTEFSAMKILQTTTI